MSGVGEQIRHYRKERGLTLSDLAAKTGVSVSYLSEIEQGKKRPSLRTLERICAGLNLSKGAVLMSSAEGKPSGRDSGQPVGLGEKIRLARRNKGRTLEELARSLGLSESYLSAIEQGKRRPGVATLHRIAEALQVPLPVLLHESPRSLGEKMRLLRERLGLSREDLAGRTGVSPSLVAQLEVGRAQPSLDTLERIASVLGVSPCYLILEDPSVEQMLTTMNPDLRRLLSEPEIQAVLPLICDLTEKEFRFLLRFIQLLKQGELS